VTGCWAPQRAVDRRVSRQGFRRFEHLVDGRSPTAFCEIPGVPDDAVASDEKSSAATHTIQEPQISGGHVIGRGYLPVEIAQQGKRQI